MGPSLKLNQLGAEGDLLKLEIDPKFTHLDGGKQKLMDKGRISKFNKNFKTLNLVKNKCLMHL